jgi:plasmid maintenance system killer protein
LKRIYQSGKLFEHKKPLMTISFANKKLQKLFNNSTKLSGEFGSECAARIVRRLTEMEAAESQPPAFG